MHELSVSHVMEVKSSRLTEATQSGVERCYAEQKQDRGDVSILCTEMRWGGGQTIVRN